MKAGNLTQVHDVLLEYDIALNTEILADFLRKREGARGRGGTKQTIAHTLSPTPEMYTYTHKHANLVAWQCTGRY